MSAIFIYSVIAISLYFYFLMGVQLHRKLHIGDTVVWTCRRYTVWQKLPMYLVYVFGWPIIILVRVLFILVEPLF